MKKTEQAKAVVCVESGERYPSVRKAAKAAHRNHGQDIRDCCDGIRDNIDGFHYRWEEQECESNERAKF